VDRVHLKPEHLTPFQAAAIPLAGVTSYRALFKVRKNFLGIFLMFLEERRIEGWTTCVDYWNRWRCISGSIFLLLQC